MIGHNKFGIRELLLVPTVWFHVAGVEARRQLCVSADQRASLSLSSLHTRTGLPSSLMEEPLGLEVLVMSRPALLIWPLWLNP